MSIHLRIAKAVFRLKCQTIYNDCACMQNRLHLPGRRSRRVYPYLAKSLCRGCCTARRVSPHLGQLLCVFSLRSRRMHAARQIRCVWHTRSKRSRLYDALSRSASSAYLSRSLAPCLRIKCNSKEGTILKDEKSLINLKIFNLIFIQINIYFVIIFN